MCFLWDLTIDAVRGVVMELVTMTHSEPPESTRKREFRLVPEGIWISDAILGGTDVSSQIWAHHFPPRLFRGGVEIAEKWLFGMSRADVMVKEL
jgi:hypothetical protein